jgi:hypothetical protein
MKVFVVVLLLGSYALALPALGSKGNIFSSSFCRQQQCRLIGWNDNFDSFGLAHNCGVDYDFDHYRIGNFAALYEYRLSRTPEQTSKNPVLGFQVQLQTGQPHQSERLLERLVLYATGIRAKIDLAKLERLYGEKLRRGENDNQPLVLPILRKPHQKSPYVLSFGYGQVGMVVFVRFENSLGC